MLPTRLPPLLELTHSCSHRLLRPARRSASRALELDRVPPGLELRPSPASRELAFNPPLLHLCSAACFSFSIACETAASPSPPSASPSSSTAATRAYVSIARTHMQSGLAAFDTCPTVSGGIAVRHVIRMPLIFFSGMLSLSYSAARGSSTGQSTFASPSRSSPISRQTASTVITRAPAAAYDFTSWMSFLSSVERLDRGSTQASPRRGRAARRRRSPAPPSRSRPPRPPPRHLPSPRRRSPGQRHLLEQLRVSSPACASGPIAPAPSSRVHHRSCRRA